MRALIVPSIVVVLVGCSDDPLVAGRTVSGTRAGVDAGPSSDPGTASDDGNGNDGERASDPGLPPIPPRRCTSSSDCAPSERCHLIAATDTSPPQQGICLRACLVACPSGYVCRPEPHSYSDSGVCSPRCDVSACPIVEGLYVVCERHAMDPAFCDYRLVP